MDQPADVLSYGCYLLARHAATQAFILQEACQGQAQAVSLASSLLAGSSWCAAAFLLSVDSVRSAEQGL